MFELDDMTYMEFVRCAECQEIEYSMVILELIRRAISRRERMSLVLENYIIKALDRIISGVSADVAFNLKRGRGKPKSLDHAFRNHKIYREIREIYKKNRKKNRGARVEDAITKVVNQEKFLDDDGHPLGSDRIEEIYRKERRCDLKYIRMKKLEIKSDIKIVEEYFELIKEGMDTNNAIKTLPERNKNLSEKAIREFIRLSMIYYLSVKEDWSSLLNSKSGT